MIQVSEQKTNNPNYSLGRRNMTQNQIWETEDNGGFYMTTVMGETHNHKRFTPESVQNALKDLNKRIETGEAIVVSELNDDYSLPLDRACAKIVDAHLTDKNNIAVKMILLDTPHGQLMKTILKNNDTDKLEMSVEGIVNQDNLDKILNVKVNSEN